MVLEGPCTRDTPCGGRERGATGAFGRGVAWKSKFLYRYRPEGIFRIFFGLILDPPPVHMLLQRKKANSFVPAIFSPWHCLFRQGCSYTVERDRGGGVASAPLSVRQPRCTRQSMLFHPGYLAKQGISYPASSRGGPSSAGRLQRSLGVPILDLLFGKCTGVDQKQTL